MKFRSLMTVICMLATANIVSAAPFAYIANSGTNNVSVIDTLDNSIKATVTLPTGTQPYPYSVAVSPSGQYVYVGIQDTNKIAIIDAATNTLLPQVIDLATDNPGGLAINAAETRLYVTSNKSNTLIVIDITNIKIGSGSLPEVGRVAVDTVTISNPEGVAILSDVNGNSVKAYVANAFTGTVAIVSLDEVNNLYPRTALITVGGNPMGVTLNKAGVNATGSKLYVANLNGTVAVIDTETNAVFDSDPIEAGIQSPVVGTGTLSVAVKDDDSQVYAPSNSLDKIYEITGSTNVVSGTTYAVTAAPFGSAVAPNNNLYVAMYGSNQLAVFNTSTHLFGAPINLTGGTQPTSMGDFIGPDFPYTITSTKSGACTISPEGIIPVNSYGRSFTITGACEVKVDGASVGQPSIYNFSNLSASHTIDASPATATPYVTLSGNWITSIGGYLVSNPVGISQLSKSAQFTTNSSVTLSVGDSVNHQVQTGSWTGDCAGSGATCTVVMNANKTFGATIIAKPLGVGPIYNVTKSSYHQTLAEATAAATTNDVIKIANTYLLGGSTTGTPGVTVTLSGNWDPSFGTQTGSVSMGALTITSVAVIANNLTL